MWTRAEALADQRRRKRRYFALMGVRIGAVPALFLVPHRFIGPATVIAVMSAMSAVMSGNDPDAAQYLFPDQDDQPPTDPAYLPSARLPED